MLQWGRNFIVAETRQINRTAVYEHRLQWGRNFIVAETRLPRSPAEIGQDASMGPQLYRCGNISLRHAVRFGAVASMGPQLYRCGNLRHLLRATREISMLQWGRNFIVAETQVVYSWGDMLSTRFNGAATLSLRKLGVSCEIPVTSVGFNGAATLSLRKLHRRKPISAKHYSLQWGRNFIVAETGEEADQAHHDTGASMGPQLYRCGNTCNTSGPSGICPCFNGAATLSLRKP